MEPAGTEVSVDTWGLNKRLALARAALALAHRRIRQHELLAAEQLAIIQDTRRQMYNLGIKEYI